MRKYSLTFGLPACILFKGRPLRLIASFTPLISLFYFYRRSFCSFCFWDRFTLQIIHDYV